VPLVGLFISLTTINKNTRVNEKWLHTHDTTQKKRLGTTFLSTFAHGPLPLLILIASLNKHKCFYSCTLCFPAAIVIVVVLLS
jgi:hypothetical protein